jgi:polyhydroxyalkanoate synthesis regulator phasin
MSKVYINLEDIVEHAAKIKPTFAPLHRAVIDAFVQSIINNVPAVEADIDELKKEVADLNNRRHLIWALGVDYDGCNTVESLKELIDELVSYTQLPREQVPDITSRTGRWIQSEEWAEDFTCSLCGNTAFKDDHGNYNVRTKYCPHCGAKMKED